MIRSAFVLAAALVSVSAYATPRVGDYAAYDVSIALNGQTMQATLQQELVQHDATQNQFLQRQTIDIPGQQQQVEDSWTPASDFLDDATIEAILGNCAAANGTPQTITVPAGTFDTCAVKFENEGSTGTAFITKVPFGAARVDSVRKEDGMVINTALKAFR